MTEYWYELNRAYDCSNRYVLTFVLHYRNGILQTFERTTMSQLIPECLDKGRADVIIFTILYSEFLVFLCIMLKISMHYASQGYDQHDPVTFDIYTWLPC